MSTEDTSSERPTAHTASARPGQQASEGQAIEPLTRHNAEGQQLERLPDVEQQIRQAVALDPAQLRQRVAIAEESAPGYLKPEVLVYLVRRAHRVGDQALLNDLTVSLLARCTAVLRRRLGALGAAAFQEGSDDFAAQLFEHILDGDRGDFLQVRFWVVVERLAITVFSGLVRERRHAGQTVPLSSIAGYEPEAEEFGPQVRPDAAENLVAPSDEDVVISNDLIREALSRVQEPYRTAYLLRYYAGWPIEDQDPNVPTISRKFGVDPRTIRNWLKRAQAALQAWLGEQDR